MLINIVNRPLRRFGIELVRRQAPPPPPPPRRPVPTDYDLDLLLLDRAAARASAEEVVPHLIRLLGPSSVLDVGCAVGTWLKVFVEHGIDDVFGVDGVEVPASALEIPAGRFRRQDLRRHFELPRTFDLAVCLEVAEHLPAVDAEALVGTLTRHAPAIAFSAATPGQTGIGHVNERWPAFWADLFARRGYVPFDMLRESLWHNEGIAWWYRQNLLLYVKRDAVASYPALLQYERVTPARSVVALVHPDNPSARRARE